MPTHTSEIEVTVTAASRATLEVSSALPIQWNFPSCDPAWFRVAGVCFKPAPTASCPPYPAGGQPGDCFVQPFPLTTLFNSGVGSDGVLLAACDEVQTALVLPSQYPFVLATAPAGVSPVTPTAQYIGLACDGAAPPGMAVTVRFPFVLPDNVAASTVEVELLLDTPNRLLNVFVNEQPTGLSVTPPVVARQFLLTGHFVAGANTIDVQVLVAADQSVMGVMAQFPTVRGCVAQGSLPPGANPGCLVNLTTNVRACDANDVCRILRQRGLVFPIESIRRVVNGSLDYNCFPDVTPTLDDCTDCCDFLVDEDLADEWAGEAVAYELFEYTSVAEVSVAPASAYRIGFPYTTTAEVVVTPESTAVPVFVFGSVVEVVVTPATESFPSSYEFESAIAVVVTPATEYSASDYEFDTSAEAVVVPASGAEPRYVWGSVIEAAATPASASSANLIYTTAAVVDVTPSVTIFAAGLSWVSVVEVAATPASGITSSVWEYVGEAAVVVTAGYQSIWATDSVIEVAATPASTYLVAFVANSLVEVVVTPASEVTAASAWVWAGESAVEVTSGTTYECSDLGDIEAEGFGFVDVTGETDVFEPVPAPALSTVIPVRAVTGCCPAVPERLEFRHNLGSVPRLSAFLRRNGLVLPGQLVANRSVTFIPVTYSAVQAAWTGSVYLTGLSPSGAGQERWSLSIEFGCTTSWRVAVRLFRADAVSDGSLRVVSRYTPAQVCPAPSGFVGFAAAIDPVRGVSSPPAIGLVVNDEEDSVLVSPAALLLQFSAITSGREITFPALLERQLRAATTVTV